MTKKRSNSLTVVPTDVHKSSICTKSYIACTFGCHRDKHKIESKFEFSELGLEAVENAFARIREQIKDFEVGIKGKLMYVWVYISDKFSLDFVKKQAQLIQRELRKVGVDLIIGDNWQLATSRV